MSTPEERIASLEQSLKSMGEGIVRMERTIDKLDGTLSSLMDKLDVKYPSRENVELRFDDTYRAIKAIREQMGVLRSDHDTLETRVQKVQAWQYKVAGGIAVIAFALGVAARAIWG